MSISMHSVPHTPADLHAQCSTNACRYSYGVFSQTQTVLSDCHSNCLLPANCDAHRQEEILLIIILLLLSTLIGMLTDRQTDRNAAAYRSFATFCHEIAKKTFKNGSSYYGRSSHINTQHRSRFAINTGGKILVHVYSIARRHASPDPI